MFLDSDHLWFLGNMLSLHEFSKIYHQVLDRPSPLLCQYHTAMRTHVPTTLDKWRQAQQNVRETSLRLTAVPRLAYTCTW